MEALTTFILEDIYTIHYILPHEPDRFEDASPFQRETHEGQARVVDLFHWWLKNYRGQSSQHPGLLTFRISITLTTCST